MSRIAELLEQKRAAQIRRMEGEEVDEREMDAELAALSGGPRSRRRSQIPSTRLVFSSHARQRMAQRGMSAKTVYTIWRVGQEVAQPDGRKAFVVTRSSLEVAERRDAKLLKRWQGCAIVVSYESPPVLVTVLAAGEDTRVARNRH